MEKKIIETIGWLKDGKVVTKSSFIATDLQKTLPKGVYTLQFNEMMGSFYLTIESEAFSLPPKVYGVETDLISRVVKTWAHTTNNLGVLLNGIKGTGKTVTAKLICEALGLPVIIIPKDYDNRLVQFISSVEEEVIFFFDEYEKIYEKKGDNSVLVVLDGVANTHSKKMFLLTTNSTRVNDNLIQRPGRIRYLATFDNLKLPSIIEIVDDRLKHKHHRDASIKFISELDLITVDIVCAVIDEVNIHNEAPAVFESVFNTKKGQSLFNVHRIEGKDDIIVDLNCRVAPGFHFGVDPENAYNAYAYSNFHVENKRIGEISDCKLINGEFIIEVDLNADKEDEPEKIVKYKISKAKHVHSSFMSYAF